MYVVTASITLQNPSMHCDRHISLKFDLTVSSKHN